jgi:phosphoribosylanthranilate isomerase
VLITYEGTARGIDRFCRALGVWRVQLHGDIAIDELAALRRLRPDLFIVKSLVVGREDPSELFALAATCSRWVDAFITDTFDPETGAEGATGHVHDWEISRRLVAATPRPVILAGGLRPDNVAAAIRAVRPAGVDVHTGVEDAAGRKDAALVARFVAEARAAFQALAKEEPHACP